MALTVAGKCLPEPDSLAAAYERGFDAAEVQLTTEYLEQFDESVAAVENSDIEAVSIHTPHTTLEDPTYFSEAARFAETLDAYLVVHSQYLQHVHISELEALELPTSYGYENNPGANLFHLQQMILDQDHEFVFDTAHFYMSEPAFYEQTEHLLDDYDEQISVVHLSDSTRQNDGLPFGEGTVDIERLSRLMKRLHDGIVVLEIRPLSKQEDALSVLTQA